MRHIWGLDLIRFAAAMLVVMFHFRGFGLDAPDFKAPPGLRAFPGMEPWAWFGWIGVEIFFVISGFVIFASALDGSAGTFIVKRAIRVLPALWLSAALAFVMRALWGEPLGELIDALVRSMLLSPLGPYIDGVVWTLVVEAIYYLFIAGVIVGGGYAKVRPPHRRSVAGGRAASLEVAAYVLGMVSSAFLALALLAKAGHWSFHGLDLAELVDRFFFEVLLLRPGVFFAIGMLIHRMSADGVRPLRLLATIGFCAIGCGEIAMRAGSDRPYALPIITFLLAILALVIAIRVARHPLPRPAAKLCALLGLMTYTIYLNHFTFAQYLIPLVHRAIASRALVFLVALAGVLAVSWAMTRWPERSAQALLRRRLLMPPGRHATPEIALATPQAERA